MSFQHDRRELSYYDTRNANVVADINGATTNYHFGARCFGNPFATRSSARMVALKNVGAASPGRPFAWLFGDCPQNVSLAMI